MTNHSKSKSTTSKSLTKDKKNNLILGSIVATLIAITPYLFYLYESVPDEKVWSTFLFTYDSTSWGSANLAFWIIVGKLVPIFLLFIWFFTCRHWWYHVLLIPIAMYGYQLFAIINEDLQYIDEYQIMVLIPIMAIIIPSIYLIRAKMFNRLTSQSMQDLEDEYRLGPKSIWDKVKEFF